ncbi:FAD-dependent oxidoreductase [Burkholderia sp. Ax-1724]|nr:FAD-dependent oxidoreductase [Burkholderia sp. Ax-1724]
MPCCAPPSHMADRRWSTSSRSRSRKPPRRSASGWAERRTGHRNMNNAIRTDNRPIAVLGAGAVGLCAAAALHKAGYEVVVIDRAAPAQGGASLGNAGCINPSSIIPVAMPGVVRKVPGWLLQPDGPLVLRAAWLPRMLPWLTSFVRAGNAATVEASAAALQRLLAGNVEAWQALAAQAGARDLLHDRGNLVVYSTAEGHAADQRAIRLRTDHGIAVETLDTAALRDLEPDLAPVFTRGYLMPGNAHLTDPGEFLTRIADWLATRGVEFRRAEISGLRSNGSAVTEVVLTGETLPVQAVVIALGAWSGPLARTLGDRVLLDTERGYHVETPETEAGPRLPVMWGEGKVVVTPMHGRVRCAGTVELAGLRAAPDWRRADLLARLLGRMYPRLTPGAERDGSAHMARWLGFRPSTPDSLPVIGRSRRHANAVYAFGHGHVGLTAAPVTGRLVASLIAGRPAAIDLAPYSIDRFR